MFGAVAECLPSAEGGASADLRLRLVPHPSAGWEDDQLCPSATIEAVSVCLVSCVVPTSGVPYCRAEAHARLPADEQRAIGRALGEHLQRSASGCTRPTLRAIVGCQPSVSSRLVPAPGARPLSALPPPLAQSHNPIAPTPPPPRATGLSIAGRGSRAVWASDRLPALPTSGVMTVHPAEPPVACRATLPLPPASAEPAAGPLGSAALLALWRVRWSADQAADVAPSSIVGSLMWVIGAGDSAPARRSEGVIAVAVPTSRHKEGVGRSTDLPKPAAEEPGSADRPGSAAGEGVTGGTRRPATAASLADVDAALGLETRSGAAGHAVEAAPAAGSRASSALDSGAGEEAASDGAKPLVARLAAGGLLCHARVWPASGQLRPGRAVRGEVLLGGAEVPCEAASAELVAVHWPGTPRPEGSARGHSPAELAAAAAAGRECAAAEAAARLGHADEAEAGGGWLDDPGAASGVGDDAGDSDDGGDSDGVGGDSGGSSSGGVRPVAAPRGAVTAVVSSWASGLRHVSSAAFSLQLPPSAAPSGACAGGTVGYALKLRLWPMAASPVNWMVPLTVGPRLGEALRVEASETAFAVVPGVAIH